MTIGTSATGTAAKRIRILDEPVGSPAKSAYVRAMFDAIAPRYDLLNSLLSFGVHRSWRRFAVRCAALSPGESVLDVCAGTGELGADLYDAVGACGLIASTDFSLPMLRAGDARYKQFAGWRGQADAAALPFAANSFDAAMVAFGLRNVADPQRALSEMARVVRPGGRVVVLEFAQPRPEWFARLFQIYSRTVMPRLGGWIAGRTEAYAYLPESVKRWKSRDELGAMLASAGLRDVRRRDLTLGIACVHVGVK